MAKLKLVALDTALEIASCGLGVDDHVFITVLVPYRLDVAVPVVTPCIGVSDEKVVWTQDSQWLSVVLVDQFIPRSTVALGLRTQLFNDSPHSISTHAWHCLGLALGVGQAKPNRNADKVDIADIREQLRVVVSELAERPVDVEVRVAGVGHTGLYDCRTWVEEESKLCTNAEPDTTAGNLWDPDVDSVARSPKWDGDVGLEWLLDILRRCWIVDGLAVCFHKEGSVVPFQSKAGNVRVYGAGIGLVLQRQLKSARCGFSHHLLLVSVGFRSGCALLILGVGVGVGIGRYRCRCRIILFFAAVLETLPTLVDEALECFHGNMQIEWVWETKILCRWMQI